MDGKMGVAQRRRPEPSLKVAGVRSASRPGPRWFGALFCSATQRRPGPSPLCWLWALAPHSPPDPPLPHLEFQRTTLG